MSTNIITPVFNNIKINNIIEDIGNIPHYIFFAKITQYQPTDIVIPDANYDQGSTDTSIYDDMIFGKKINSSDISLVVRRVSWQSGIVYDQYSYSDPNLLDKDFYVAASQGALTGVYKCLDNNSGAPSTIKPTGQDTSVFQTSDGYVWKYLYSFNEVDDSNFGMTGYMPLIVDPNVTNAAKPGTIDAIHIISRGSTYLNNLRSSFVPGSIKFGGDPEKYLIDTSAETFNDFYNGCIILITSGVAAGAYKKITNYEISNANKIIELESAFDVAPQPGDTYEIMPSILIQGDGNETTPAIARAVVDNTTNIITNIDILNPGENYRKALVSVYTDNTSAPASPAIIDASISPKNGHGYDIQSELGASAMIFSITVDGTENGSAPIDNDFRTIGIIRSPLFNNFKIFTIGNSQIGFFHMKESVVQYRELLLNDVVGITASSSTITSSAGAVQDRLNINDQVLISNGSKNHYGIVDSISNSSFTLSGKLPSWSNTTASISVISPIANGVIEEIESSSLLLNKCTPTFSNNVSSILGLDSFASVKIDYTNNDNMTIYGNKVNGFDYFSQLYRVTGSYSSNTSFSEDEVVKQDNGVTAVVYSTENIVGSDTISLVDMSGPLSANSLITSSYSLSSFTINETYEGNLEKNSGDLLYIEHVLPIRRTANTAQTIKILFDSSSN